MIFPFIFLKPLQEKRIFAIINGERGSRKEEPRKGNRMKITLCIPLYNEEAIVSSTMEEIRRYMTGTFGEDYEVIYINDGSTDQSLERIKEGLDPHARLISYEPNRGKGYAVRQGMLDARGEIVIFTDCDLAYGLDVVGEMTRLFEKNPGCDAIVGSRALHPEGYEGYGFSRRLASKAYLRVLSSACGLKLSDSQSGIKGFRQEMAKKVFSRCETNGFSFDFEAILLTRELGGRILEMPVKIINHRDSSIRLVRDGIRMLRELRQIKKRVKSKK